MSGCPRVPAEHYEFEGQDLSEGLGCPFTHPVPHSQPALGVLVKALVVGGAG